MTWDAYHRRKSVLREILAIADRDRGLALTDLLDTLDPERLVFESDTEALLEIQMAWFQRLSGHVDRLMGEDVDTPEMVAASAWVATAADFPGGRALLDAHRDSRELAFAFAKERTLLATAAGVPSNHPDAREHGERIIAAARVEAAKPSSGSDESAHDTQPRSLMTRLRNAIAA